METFLLSHIFLNHVKIGPVKGIEVFESAGTLVIGVEAPSWPTGNLNSRVYHKEFNSTNDNLFLN